MPYGLFVPEGAAGLGPRGHVPAATVSLIGDRIVCRHVAERAKKMTNKFDPLEVADLTGLTDADWAEINKLKSAHEAGGQKALSAALKALGQDPILYLRIMAAFFPIVVARR